VTEQDTPVAPVEHGAGRIVMGALLVAAGAALLLEQLGAMPPLWRVGIWPVLLIAYGLARMLQPRRRGREGLFFVLGGAWWLACSTGWMSLERTWPLLFVALGISIMFQSVTVSAQVDFDAGRIRGRRHGGAGWILIAILVGAALTSGVGRRPRTQDSSGTGALHVYSVLGGTNTHATTLTGGEAVSIMGGSDIDLRDVTLAPGETVTLDVFALMGGDTIRVPASWVVEMRAVPIMGGIKDQRASRDGQQGAPGGPDGAAPTAGSAPHLIVRGTVIMGGLVIKS